MTGYRRRPGSGGLPSVGLPGDGRRETRQPNRARVSQVERKICREQWRSKSNPRFLAMMHAVSSQRCTTTVT